MPFRLTSPAFADGAGIPARHTCDGENRSPLLTWSDVPEGTASFALIMDDPDAPGGVFTHWVLYDIPADGTELGESLGESSPGVAGMNSFRQAGYGGPCPPKHDPPHRYRFALHALDVPSLGLPRHASRRDVEAAMAGHVLGVARLTGTYQRTGRK
ncbi:MAG TPA: YbhB/YbcL family Raf kinase inhibitor-like protein [Vicinamibacterales bacterium]